MNDDIEQYDKRTLHNMIKQEYLEYIKQYHFEINYQNTRQQEQDRIIEFIDEITVLSMKYQNKIFNLFITNNDIYATDQECDMILNRATDINQLILDNNEKIYQELRDVNDDQFYHLLLSLIKSFSEIYIAEIISRLT